MLVKKVPFLLVLLILASCTKRESIIIAPTFVVEPQNKLTTSIEDERKLRDDFEKNIGNKVYFDFDKATLTKEAKSKLQKQVTWLNSHPDVVATIEGHCDERGSKNYNLALGYRRAEAVERFFITQGINKKRLNIVTYGKDRPEAEGHTENAWKLNRRAVSVIISEVQ